MKEMIEEIMDDEEEISPSRITWSQIAQRLYTYMHRNEYLPTNDTAYALHYMGDSNRIAIYKMAILKEDGKPREMGTPMAVDITGLPEMCRQRDLMTTLFRAMRDQLLARMGTDLKIDHLTTFSSNKTMIIGPADLVRLTLVEAINHIESRR